MTPRFHENGTHFKGLARYLLHDIDADTSGRVEHTETRNLSTNNPQAAWRVMSAVSMNQDRLKKAAGVRPGGRQSKDHCGHASISWNPEEGTNVSREEMIRCADYLMAKIKADQYQALYVIHNDTDHKHIHIMWNRVNPEDGRILSPKFSKMKASRFAEQYEKQRVKEGKADKLYCPQREINNKLRDEGHYVRYDGWKSRDDYERCKIQQEQDAKWKKIDLQRKQMAELKQRQRDQRLRHALQQTDLLKRHQQLKSELLASRNQMLADARREASLPYKSSWEQLLHEHDAEMALFNQQEQTLRGRLKNAFGRIDFQSVFGRGNSSDDGKITTVAEIFELGDSGKRLEILKAEQAIRENTLRQEQRQAEAAAEELAKATYKLKLIELERQREQEINDLQLAQQIEHSKEQIAIVHLGQQHRLEVGLPKALRKTVSVADPSRYGTPANDSNASRSEIDVYGPSDSSQAWPADLLPAEGSELAAYQIRSEKERRRSIDEELQNKKDNDRGGTSR